MIDALSNSLFTQEKDVVFQHFSIFVMALRATFPDLLAYCATIVVKIKHESWVLFRCKVKNNVWKLEFESNNHGFNAKNLRLRKETIGLSKGRFVIEKKVNDQYSACFVYEMTQGLWYSASHGRKGWFPVEISPHTVCKDASKPIPFSAYTQKIGRTMKQADGKNLKLLCGDNSMMAHRAAFASCKAIRIFCDKKQIASAEDVVTVNLSIFKFEALKMIHTLMYYGEIPISRFNDEDVYELLRLADFLQCDIAFKKIAYHIKQRRVDATGDEFCELLKTLAQKRMFNEFTAKGDPLIENINLLTYYASNGMSARLYEYLLTLYPALMGIGEIESLYQAAGSRCDQYLVQAIKARIKSQHEFEDSDTAKKIFRIRVTCTLKPLMEQFQKQKIPSSDSVSDFVDGPYDLE